jgi:hypothetical protein
MANLKLIEEMGIVPNRTFRIRRPTLKVIAIMVRFCVRARNAGEAWKEKRAIQESLVRKMESIGRGRSKKHAAR